MKPLTPPNEITVPPPVPDERYRTGFLDDGFSFEGLKRLLGAADVGKAGDRGTALAAIGACPRRAMIERLKANPGNTPRPVPGLSRSSA